MRIWFLPTALFEEGSFAKSTQVITYPVSGYLVALLVQSATPSHTTVAQKLNWVLVSKFWTIYSLIVVRLLSKRDSQGIRFFHTFYHSKFLLNVGMTSSKTNWKRYLTKLLVTFCPTHLNKKVGLLNLPFSKGSSSSLVYLMLNDQIEMGGEFYKINFENVDTTLSICEHSAFFFPLTATSSQPGWYTSSCQCT